MTRLLPSLLGLLILGNVAIADQPTASFVFPAGGQRGTTVPVAVGGLHLGASSQLEVIGPGISAPPTLRRGKTRWFEGPILPLPESQQAEDYPQEMQGEFRLASDARPGLRSLRLWNSQGVTQPLRFVVGTLPEVIEEEIPGRAVPVTVTAPVTINGRIFPREDVDLWAVTLMQNETVTIAVLAAGLGSPMQAHIEVRDPSGKVLAEPGPSMAVDPTLSFTAPSAGVYHVAIRDAAMKGSPASVYRLTLTTGPATTGVFPAGGRIGTNLPVELSSATGPSRQTTVRIPATSAPGIDHELVPGLPFDLDVHPEYDSQCLRQDAITLPAVLNGKIHQAGIRHEWRLLLRKGRPIELAMLTSELRSPLLPLVTIHDPAGKVAQTYDVDQLTRTDGRLSFTPAADGVYRFEVSDTFDHRGGDQFVYRLKVTEPTPGYDLAVVGSSLTLPRGGTTNVKVQAIRRGGFTGPIDLIWQNLPAGVTLPASITIAANQSSLDIPLKVDATAKIRSELVTLQGIGWHATALGDVIPLRSQARTQPLPGEPGLTPLRLAIAYPCPFKIVGEYTLALHPRGSRLTRSYRLERQGYDGPITITLAEKQARHLQGVTGGTVVVPAGATSFEYAVDLPPWMETGRTCRVCVMGTATVKDADGSEHSVSFTSREQNEQMIAVVEPGRLGIELGATTVAVTPGATVSVPVVVRRASDLSGPVRIMPVLPPRLSGCTAEPITIPAGESRADLVLRFDRSTAGPFLAPVIVRAVLDTPRGPVTAEGSFELIPR